MSKKFIHRGGITIFARIFLSMKSSGCFWNFWRWPSVGRSNFLVNHRGGYHPKMSKTFRVKIREGGLFWCFGKFLVSKKFIHKKRYQEFWTNFCRLRAPKKIVGAPFGFSAFYLYIILYIRGGGSITNFWTKNYLSHRAEKFRTRHLVMVVSTCPYLL